jgi:hypothetical protein
VPRFGFRDCFGGIEKMRMVDVVLAVMIAIFLAGATAYAGADTSVAAPVITASN